MNGSNGETVAAVTAADTAEQTQYLRAILAELRSDLLQIGVLDGSRREMILDQWPVPGSKRILAYRTGNGTDSVSVTTTGLLIMTANEARIGSSWTNSGSFPALLYLANAQRAGVLTLWLAANGGSWDGRISGLPWAGHVFAVGSGGTTTLVGGEL